MTRNKGRFIIFLLPLSAVAVSVLAAALTVTPSNYLWYPVPTYQRDAVVSACGEILLVRAVSWSLVSLSAVSALVLASMGRKKPATGFGLGVLVCLLVWPAAQAFQAPRLLVIFENQAVAEPYIQEALLQAGVRVGPFLIPKLREPGFHNRRYAISAVGRLELRSAVPVLYQVLRDRSESVFIRGDAYEALHQIGSSEARQQIRTFEETLDATVDQDLIVYISSLSHQ